MTTQKHSSTDNAPLASNLSLPAHRATAGERAFDWLVYGGIGYIANAAISLAVAYHAIIKKGSWLNRASKSSQKIFGHIFQGLGQSEKQITSNASLANDIFFLGAGGWLLMVPMKWMEDAKYSIVKTLDARFGTQPKTPEEQTAQQVHFESIPKQNYTSLLGGRVVAYVATITAAVWAMKKFKIDTHMNTAFNKFIPDLYKGFKQPEKLVDFTSKEIILAGTAAALTYGASKLIAHVDHHTDFLDGEREADNTPLAKIEKARHERTLAEKTLATGRQTA